MIATDTIESFSLVIPALLQCFRWTPSFQVPFQVPSQALRTPNEQEEFVHKHAAKYKFPLHRLHGDQMHESHHPLHFQSLQFRSLVKAQRLMVTIEL